MPKAVMLVTQAKTEPSTARRLCSCNRCFGSNAKLQGGDYIHPEPGRPAIGSQAGNLEPACSAISGWQGYGSGHAMYPSPADGSYETCGCTYNNATELTESSTLSSLLFV